MSEICYSYFNKKMRQHIARVTANCSCCWLVSSDSCISSGPGCFAAKLWVTYHCSCFQHYANAELMPIQCKLLSSVVTMWRMVEIHSCQFACSAFDWRLSNGKQLMWMCLSVGSRGFFGSVFSVFVASHIYMGQWLLSVGSHSPADD